MRGRRIVGIAMAGGGAVISIALFFVNDYYCAGLFRTFRYEGNCGVLTFGLMASVIVAIAGAAVAALPSKSELGKGVALQDTKGPPRS